MRIRPEQIESLERDAELRQIAEIIAILKREIPESVEDIPATELAWRVRYAMRRANAFLGKHAKAYAGGEAAMLWVRLMFEVSPDFDRDPSCVIVLNDIATPPQGRILSLLRESNEIDWVMVAARCGRTWPAPE